MKNLPSLAVCALMAPAITFGIGSAFATDPPAGAYPQAKDQRTTQEQQQMPAQSQKDKGMSTADRAQENRMAADRAKQQGKDPGTHLAQGTYLSNAPANSFRPSDLIGANLKSRSDNENIGTISDLVIDEDGQIVAVIVEVGGFLGLGKKEVAVSWDSVERRLIDKDDDHDFSVMTTKDALKDAPEFKTETRSTGTRSY